MGNYAPACSFDEITIIYSRLHTDSLKLQSQPCWYWYGVNKCEKLSFSLFVTSNQVKSPQGLVMNAQGVATVRLKEKKKSLRNIHDGRELRSLVEEMIEESQSECLRKVEMETLLAWKQEFNKEFNERVRCHANARIHVYGLELVQYSLTTLTKG